MKAMYGTVLFLTMALLGCGALHPQSELVYTDPDGEAALLTAAWNKAERGNPHPSGEEGESLHVAKLKLLDHAERLALEHPRHVETLLLCATLSFDLDRPDNAFAYLDALLEVDPTHAEAGILRSRIALLNGNPSYAISLLRELAELNPDHAGIREAWAAALYVAGRYPEAENELTAASQLGAPEWRVSFNMGLVAEASLNYHEAETYYRQCLEQNPDWTAARRRLGGLGAPR